MKRARVVVWPLLLSAAAGCVSETKTAAPTETKGAIEVGGVSADHEAALGQALVEIDKRVDEYVGLSAESGDDARSTRGQLGNAIAAQVKRYKSDLLAMAGDAANPSRRVVAAKALGFCDDPAAVTALNAMLGVKGDVRLLTSATYSLGRLRSPQTRADLLLVLVGDADSDVRSNALLALARTFDARRAVGASPLDPIEERDAMVLLEPALSDPADPLIRAHAAKAIGALDDKRGVDPLIDLLRDPHPLVRMETAIALAKLGDAKAVPALVGAIDSTPSGTPRHTVVLALSALCETLGHRPPETLGEESLAWRRWAKDALSEVVDPLK